MIHSDGLIDYQYSKMMRSVLPALEEEQTEKVEDHIFREGSEKNNIDFP